MSNFQINNSPEFLTSHDLVELGIFSTLQSVYISRRRGCGPDYVKFGRKVVYPKYAVIEFIKKHLVQGNVPAVKAH